MRMMLIILGGLTAVVVAGAVGLFAWGARLPEYHTALASDVIPASVNEVFERITDIANHPKWRTGVKSIDIVEAGRWVEDGSNGRIPFRIVESAAPSRLVIRIDTTELPFEGTWTYTLQAVSGGTRLQIKEDGQVKSAMFRAMGRLFFPHDKTMREFLADLKRSFSDSSSGSRT